ncbi:MAG: lytic transglycosylase domain-containing protein [Bacteroidales bacterium]|nr:lytic transglycosylase domain-containing protein [Bacteroidales bacterium]
MNRIVSYILLSIIILLLIVGLDRFVIHKKSELPGTNEQYYKIVAVPIPDKISFAGEQLPLDIFYVREALDRELSVNTYWHSATLQIIKKSQRWFPVFDSILSANNIPQDFKYLAVIESALSNVTSPAGAVGYWQFLKGTAKENGLEVNKEVDERYNVIKSTEAACRYFNKSYEKFGNWTLVAAAYNAGNRGVSRQIERQKTESFYDLLLSDETTRYIYRLAAMKIIFENPQIYGFYIDNEDVYPTISTRYVIVDYKIEDFADFAKDNGVSYKLLKYFNPWLRQSYLKNRKKKVYKITIPMPPFDHTHESIILNNNGISNVE